MSDIGQILPRFNNSYMKNKFFSYLLFIILLSGFIAFRIYAGKAISSTKEAIIPPEPSDNVATEEITVTSDKPIDEEDEAFEDEHGLLNDPWHGDFTPMKTFKGTLPRIVCWGDSLTNTIDHKTSYPDVLRNISGCEVINYGVDADNTRMIAMREGAIPVSVGATVIPATKDLIPIFLEADDDGAIFFLDYGNGGVNPCYIDGIEGTLSKLNGSYYFERSETGERISVESGTPFITYGIKDSDPSDVLIIFAGTNDMPDTESVYEIIDLIHDMIKVSKCEKYIVIGLTYAGGIPDINKVNDIMSNEFEDNFLDIRSYMLSYGLEDSGITPTAKDLINISEGEIPESLRRDYVHGNKYFSDLLAKQVYRRLQYLGYVPMEQ